MITIFSPIIILLLFAVLISGSLLILQSKYPSTDIPIVESINKLLPQTQCGQCDYPGCRPYAEAISQNKADINRCPPGGQQVINNLADLLNREPKELADDLTVKPQIPLIAKINEQECIGCLLCIKACPVSAIVGANKLMHTVIADRCTGCDLCIPPCPMDCIEMVENNYRVANWIAQNPDDRNGTNNV